MLKLIMTSVVTAAVVGAAACTDTGLDFCGSINESFHKRKADRKAKKAKDKADQEAINRLNAQPVA